MGACDGAELTVGRHAQMLAIACGACGPESGLRRWSRTLFSIVWKFDDAPLLRSATWVTRVGSRRLELHFQQLDNTRAVQRTSVARGFVRSARLVPCPYEEQYPSTIRTAAGSDGPCSCCNFQRGRTW